MWASRKREEIIILHGTENLIKRRKQRKCQYLERIPIINEENAFGSCHNKHYVRKIKVIHHLKELKIRAKFLTITVVKCLRTVCEERTEHEPSTAYSSALGLHKLLVNVMTHFEIIEGHLLIILIRDFPANLTTYK